MVPRVVPAEERFWAKVDRSAGPDGCWLWLGWKNELGYGLYRSFAGGPNRPTHRIAYEYLVGPIPDGLTIDHLCRNHPCCNPSHLEPVTPRENVMRGDTIVAANAAKTHCKRGHPLSGDNLYRYLSEGRWKRNCRTCRNSGIYSYPRKANAS